MPYVVGHRGAALVQPENTVEGFAWAINLGCEYVECDVHLTRDGHLVVIHDATVDRTTNGTGPVADFTFEAIRRLDAGEGRQIPTLDEVLDVTRGRVTLLCELKGPFTADPAARRVLDRGMGDEVIFTSFWFGRIARIKQIDERLRTGAIFSEPPDDALEQAVSLGATTVGIRHGQLTPAFVAGAERLGLNLRAWNPDTEDDIRRVIALNPAGISSNRPDLVLQLLGRLDNSPA